MKLQTGLNELLVPHFLFPVRRSLAVFLGFVLYACVPCYSSVTQETNAVVVVSDLSELNEIAVMDQAVVCILKLQGTVWWSSGTEGRVILQDDTSVLQLELDISSEMPVLGENLILDGTCSLIKTRDVIKISEVPVVDNDGLHASREDSGSIRLAAGHHPIRVSWFNRTHHLSLEVEYEGPDFSKKAIPDDILFHLKPASGLGLTNYVAGLNYRCCEGQWWSRLPNLEHMVAVKSGVVRNFDISVRSRNDHVGLQYSGYIAVPKEGEYTFYVRSDDGSRLFIGESSLSVSKNGRSELPLPKRVVLDANEGDAELHWSEIEGVVTSFHHFNGALEVDLMTDVGLVRVKVAENSKHSYTLRPQNRIRAVGVIRKTINLNGRLSYGEFYVQSWDDIEQLYITPVIWSEYPLSQISHFQSTMPSNAIDSVVHLKGEVILSDQGGQCSLDDGSGSIVLSGQIPEDQVGRLANVLGVLGREGSNLILRSTLFKRLKEGGGETNNLPVLSSAEQVSQLSLTEAARGYPVRVKGVISSPLEYDGAVLQDASRGIYINTGGPLALEVGDYCEIEGVTGPFGFQPYIQVTALQKVGNGGMPIPLRPTWDQLINGSMHCNYVELEGVVTSLKGSSISLLTRDGQINLRLNPIGATLPENVQGATIRLRGSLLVDWDGESRRVKVGSIFLDQHSAAIVHPAPVDPFAIELKQIEELLHFDSQAGALRQVKVSGILLHKDTEMSYLSDGDNGLRFSSQTEINAQVGDRIEIVGFVDLSGPSPLLHNVDVRVMEASKLPAPRKLVGNHFLNDDYDSTRVLVEGVLLGVSKLQEGWMFEMQSGLRRFMVMVDADAALTESYVAGSHLEVVGVYVGQGGNRVLGRPIDSFQIHIGSVQDIRILSRPPWWTLKRLMLVVALLMGVLTASLVWVNLLHRKVEERTQQLGDQIRKRQRAERDRAIEQERARLAHDLHDDLGAGLTEVNMLSSLVKNPAIAGDKKNHYADKMNELALHMVTSLDEIVWAENPRNDTVSSLADYFETYARRLLEPASVGCIFHVANEVPVHPLDPRFRQGLFLAFKEALSNIVKHAGASVVRLGLSVEGEELVVVVSDNGCGILSNEHDAGADGLINMKERLVKLGGNCQIQSDPEKGTTIRMRARIQRLET